MALLDDSLYFHKGKEGVLHTFRVAASLDSMIVGEAQILGQLKEVFEYSLERKATGIMLNKLMKNRTTFIIAHRVQSLMQADLILVFKDGRIIQRGNHETLIDKPGFYNKVFQLQTRIELELEEQLHHG